jgi:DNA-binding HxlR family transcriptional regulator
MRYNVFDPACPTRALLDRIGDKWTVLVVCALRGGPLRFGELRRAVGGAAPKVMTAVLRSLERDGMVSRRVYTASPLRVEYDLTPLGRSLLVVVDGLRQWAERNMPKVAKARARRVAS